MREWLKTLRCDLSLNQSDVAKKIGIAQQYYSMIENGERQKRLNLSLAAKLADLFGVSVEWIAEQENAEQEERK